MSNFRDVLNEERVIIADGAMGTMLYSSGVPKGRCFDELNLSDPEIVKGIHKAYHKAGAELLETNTFGANRLVLDRYFGLGDKTSEINYRGAKLAREVAEGAFVAGSVGPVTRPLDSSEKLKVTDIEEIYSEQISSLLEGGVDLIILETMSDPEEARAGIRAARKLCDIPLLVSFSFSDEGRTITGMDPIQVSRSLEKEGIKILGVNCCSGPRDVYMAIRRMTGKPDIWLSAMPNAGLPKFIDRKFVYPHNPEYFAYYARKFLSLGVSIIGGCCGTTPLHIKAISESIVDEKVIKKKLKHLPKKERTSLYRTEDVNTQLKKKADKEFILIVEMEPPRGTDLNRELKLAKELQSIGVNALSISDSPMARVRMGPLALAHRIKDETSLEVILHKTTRDRNILGLQADCLAASALGIENMLALTGDPPSAGDYPFSAAIWEATSKELIEMIISLNSGRDLLGNQLQSPTRLWVGSASGIEPMKEVFLRLKAKIEAGAGFIMTQPVFDLDNFSKFVKEVKKFDIPIFAGVMPLFSREQAEYLHNEVPGIRIPEDIRKRADKDGVKIINEIISGLKELVSGVCIMLSKGKYSIIKELIQNK